MRTLFVSAAAAAILATSSLGFAATMQTTTGVVKSYDQHAMQLTLDDGSTYTLKKGVKTTGLKAGEKVNVSWDMSGAKKIADKISTVK